jgi:hypothetical protein
MKPTWKKYLLYGSVIIVAVALIFAGYRADWTGFGEYTPPGSEFVRSKTLWDWLELLIIPLFLAIGAYFLERSQRAVEHEIAATRTLEDRTIAENRIKEDHKLADERARLDREIAADRQQETALQAYLDSMAELLIGRKLRTTTNKEVRNVARIRTLTVLRVLDQKRRGLVVRFLYDSGLIGKDPIINLTGSEVYKAELRKANLREINLSGAMLYKADLTGADLTEAVLSGANLSRAHLLVAQLRGARLNGADLTEATLNGADLANADLTEATISDEQLATAKSLKGATLPNGRVHE